MASLPHIIKTLHCRFTIFHIQGQDSPCFLWMISGEGSTATLICVALRAPGSVTDNLQDWPVSHLAVSLANTRNTGFWLADLSDQWHCTMCADLIILISNPPSRVITSITNHCPFIHDTLATSGLPMYRCRIQTIACWRLDTLHLTYRGDNIRCGYSEMLSALTVGHQQTGGRDTRASQCHRIPYSQLWRNTQSPEYKQDKHTIFRFYDRVFIFNWEIPNHISKGECRNQNYFMSVRSLLVLKKSLALKAIFV